LDATPISLRSCFESFTREEAGVECGHSQCLKTMELWKIPPILIIQLKRFERVSGVSLKLEQCIEFPLEGLDLSDFIYASDARPMEDLISGMVPQQNEEGEGHVRTAQQDVSELRAHCARESAVRTSTKTPVYDLYAVVNHHGVIGSKGHYNAFAKHAVNGNWYSYDDRRINVINTEVIVTKHAYLLFYMRRDIKDANISDISPQRESVRRTVGYLPQPLTFNYNLNPSSSPMLKLPIVVSRWIANSVFKFS
jgi:ubiquitin carboxyl-terminal hydrolase 6/32